MKNLFIIATVSIITGILIVFFFSRTVRNNLDSKNKLAIEKWHAVYSGIDTKSNQLVRLTKSCKENTLTIDSLKMLIEGERLNFYKYKNEPKIDLINHEFHANKLYMRFMKEYAENKYSKTPELEISVKELEEEIKKMNQAVVDYNSAVKDYNLYSLSYPNIFIARKYNFKTRRQFILIYDAENKDPSIKELPEWAKGVDTI